MKTIELPKGFNAQIDDEDYALVSEYRWILYKGRNTVYAGTKIANTCMLMHRLIYKAQIGTIIDHRDMNGLNNQKNNLRCATESQNMANSKSKKKYKGIYFNKKCNIWYAICTKNRKYNIVRANSELDAAIKYNELALRLHGEFACLNEV